MAAYLAARGIKSSADETVDAIAANVLELARRQEGDVQLPGLASVLKEVSIALDLIQSVR